VDLIKAGTTDPAKVTRSALQNAASILGLFIATSVVIVDNQSGTRPHPADRHPAGQATLERLIDF
jgi:chaperonin GroEL